MSKFRSSNRQRRATVAMAIVAGGAVLCLGAASVMASTTPPSTEPPTPPVAVEEFTKLDDDTFVRGSFTDAVSGTISVTREGMDPVVIDMADLSHVAVARLTFQPGAQTPWHTHAGSSLVTVIQGEVVYVMADDCSEHSYPAGTSFVDPGHGNVHAVYNPTDSETVVVTTYLEAPAEGPTSITEGITAPADNCGLPLPAG